MPCLHEELADMSRDDLIDAGMTETAHLLDEDENIIVLTQRFGGTIYRRMEIDADDFDPICAADLPGG